MNQENQRIHELFLGHLEGTLSSLDQREFWGYLNDPAFEQIIKQLMSERFSQEREATGLDEVKQRLLLDRIFTHQDGANILKPKRHRFRWFAYVAAMCSIAIAISLIIYSVQNSRDAALDNRNVTIPHGDVSPGTSKATLTLADGRVINLSESETGIVIKGDHIMYDDANELVDLPVNTVQRLVLAAPKGGTYQLTLSDGTRVWLNAGSTLTYPSAFDGRERLVELEGEAFFEVSKSTIPFRVYSSGQTVDVLGTVFNISAYRDEPATLTTLVEGSVQVRMAHTDIKNQLMPGEQSRVQKDGGLEVRKVNLQQYIAWKDGLFYFQNTPFEEVMRQISRWYDVEVVYTKLIPDDTFTGTMRKNLSLMTVLELLNVSEIPDIQLRLVDKKLIVE